MNSRNTGELEHKVIFNEDAGKEVSAQLEKANLRPSTLPTISGLELNTILNSYYAKKSFFKPHSRMMDKLNYFYNTLDVENQNGNLSPQNYLMLLIILTSQKNYKADGHTAKVLAPIAGKFGQTVYSAFADYLSNQVWPFIKKNNITITIQEIKDVVTNYDNWKSNWQKLGIKDSSDTIVDLRRFLGYSNPTMDQLDNILLGRTKEKNIYRYYSNGQTICTIEKYLVDADLSLLPLRIKMGDLPVKETLEELTVIYQNPECAKSIAKGIQILNSFSNYSDQKISIATRLSLLKTYPSELEEIAAKIETIFTHFTTFIYEEAKKEETEEKYYYGDPKDYELFALKKIDRLLQTSTPKLYIEKLKDMPHPRWRRSYPKGDWDSGYSDRRDWNSHHQCYSFVRNIYDKARDIEVSALLSNHGIFNPSLNKIIVDYTSDPQSKLQY